MTGGPQATIHRVVLAVAALGVLISTGTAALVARIGSPEPPTATWTAWVPLLFLGFGVLAELVYVPIRRGESTEELTFIEVVLAAGLLVMPAAVSLFPPLVGLAAVHLLLRRPAVKTLFNLGSYAIAASGMTLVYVLLSRGAERFDVQSTLALVAATMAFTAINLVAMALILRVADGNAIAQTLREEWRLSGFMAVSCAGIALIGVSIASTNPTLVPFTALPVFALWYAYSAAAKHATERERTRHMLDLGEFLASQSAGQDRMDEVSAVLRDILGADRVRILEPDESGQTHQSGQSEASGQPDQPGHSGAASADREQRFELDLGANGSGTLVVVDRDQRKPGAADASLLNAVVSALSSAMRSGHAIRALAEETAKLGAVVDHASDGIVVMGSDGEIRLWSPAMVQMTGIEPDAAMAQEPPAFVSMLGQRLGTTAANSITVNVSHERAGDIREFELAGVRATGTLSLGEDEVWVVTVRDLTRERRVERLKSDFVATISHELRTPLTPIRGYARLLATRGDRLEPERRQAALEMMADRSEHLTRLVDDLLLASRVAEGSKLTVELADVPLAEILTQAVASFPALAQRMEMAVPDDALVVRCDRVRAIQCLSNLLGNAEKYTPEGSLVTLGARVVDGQVRLSVADAGPGIPQAEQERVFERFYRMEDPFTMRTGGAGLGLHIARELATAMGGSLTLHSVPGDGATFTLSLPIAASRAAGGAAQRLSALLPQASEII